MLRQIGRGPGDTKIKVTWGERDKVLQLINKDTELREYLSYPGPLGLERPPSLNLFVDGTGHAGARATIWKPGASVPVGVLAVISPVTLDPVAEWLLVWPTSAAETEFEKLLPFETPPRRP
jgi:hypothetical protein